MGPLGPPVVLPIQLQHKSGVLAVGFPSASFTAGICLLSTLGGAGLDCPDVLPDELPSLPVVRGGFQLLDASLLGFNLLLEFIEFIESSLVL
ncbi:MAG: hypothetical protein DMG36_15090 [Acidobacteria bacterium]|nr:MAG: hypothetical protein DMG36_15090 [Acidobacteriota bacterium]